MFGVRLKFVLLRYLPGIFQISLCIFVYLRVDKLSPASSSYLTDRLPTQAAVMSGCGATLLLLMMLSTAYSAPTRLSPGVSPRQVTRLASLVTAETRGLEVPRDLIAGIGAGSGAMQLVINVHTDSSGNIEVYTN